MHTSSNPKIFRSSSLRDAQELTDRNTNHSILSIIRQGSFFCQSIISVIAHINLIVKGV